MISKETEQSSSFDKNSANSKKNEAQIYRNNILTVIALKARKINYLKICAERIESYEKSQNLYDEIEENSKWLHLVTGDPHFNSEPDYARSLRRRLIQELSDVQVGVTSQLKELERRNELLKIQRQAMEEVIIEEIEIHEILNDFEIQDGFESMKRLFGDN